MDRNLFRIERIPAANSAGALFKAISCDRVLSPSRSNQHPPILSGPQEYAQSPGGENRENWRIFNRAQSGLYELARV